MSPLARSAAAAGLLATLVVSSGCRNSPSAPRQDDETSAAGAATSVRQKAAAVVPDAATTTGETDHDAEAALSRAAWARVRLPDLSVIEAHQAGRLDTAIHPGSLFKLIAARAAVDQRSAAVSARVVCPRRVDVNGRRADCVHPDLGRPLTLEDAIAHSCNHFFARLAATLDRHGLETTARRLLGRPFTTGDTPLPLVVLGVDGPTLSLRDWTRAAVAAVEPAVDAGSHDELVRGLVRAATEGTASALDDGTALTLAKTGTTVLGDGGEGLVVAWRPELDELVLVRAPGAAGRDAARLARAVWDIATRRAEPSVRVGRPRRDGGSAAARVDVLPLESYVAGVVAGEGEPTLSATVLEALAIVARSYARAPDGRHAAEGFDVCDTTHCQRLVASTAWSRAATRSTRGIVAAVGGRAVAVPYSAACSGTLVAPADLWGGGAGPAITRTGPDPGQHVVPTWTSEVSVQELSRALDVAGHRGTLLRDITVTTRTRAGHPARLALHGLVPGEIDAATFRHVVGRTLGWDVLKSHVWEVARTGAGYRFEGRGKGHGAGLCVRGAEVLSRRGEDAVRVLRAYVPGATLAAAQDRVAIRLPSGLLGEAARLSATVRTLLAETRLLLRVSAPRRVDIRVHPTIQAYQRATGRAWWTSATTSRAEDGTYRIDAAPPRVSEADALTATLRHELVHVLTGETLALAPAWAGEGLATLLGRRDDTPVSSSTVGACPAESQVRRPGQEAIRATYRAAADCVSAALPAGPATWRRLVGLADAPRRRAADVYAQ